MVSGKRAATALLYTLFSCLALHNLSQSLIGDTQRIASEQLEEPRWIASSSSWLDREACRWLGICGAAHFRPGSAKFCLRPHGGQTPAERERLDGDGAGRSAWAEGRSRPEDWTEDERVMREIPQYVLDHAPLVHLFSDEQFWPCDIEDHLRHTTPHLNYTSLQPRSEHPNLTNLDQLNQWNRGRFVYLQSDDDVEGRPEWLGGQKNIPSVPDDTDATEDLEEDVSWAEWDGRIDGEPRDDIETGRDGWFEAGDGDTRAHGGVRPNPTRGATPVPTDTVQGEELVEDLEERYATGDLWGKRVRGGRSDAPAVLIVVDKGHGIVDAFWFYFYSFNLGNVVFNVRFGNHVGDWEHSMVRFQHGQPKAVYFSEHNFGDAYSFEAVEKIGKRPVVYSATGTHAMYATAGIHQYVLPWGLLRDVTDRGPLWDPLLNSHMYTYDYLHDDLRSSNVTPRSPVGWFYFAGHWGDKFYPLSDPRQYRFAGQYHYVNGPIGPRFKNLGRKKVCQGNGRCHIRNWIYESGRKRRWVGVGEGDQLSEEDIDGIIHPSTEEGHRDK